MKNLFNSVKMTRPNSNVFDLSHDHKTSVRMGELVPTLVMECVPGDKFNIGCDALIRMAPLIAPIMHRVDCYMHYYFVPNRILWENWEDYICNGPNSGAAFPTLTMDETTVGALENYLGMPVPPVGATPEICSAFPNAAYTCIWSEYYRDQNLQTEPNWRLVDGSNDTNTDIRILRNRAWEHDYFTSALPYAQKGTAVDLPLGTVELDTAWSANPTDPVFRDTTMTAQSGAVLNSNAPDQIDVGGVGLGPNAYDPEGSLIVAPTTINDLRRAFRLQEWLEKAARGGSRYIENILSHFGVRSSDKRLNRPEYITGTKSPVIISEVLNTTGTVDNPQGNMAGHGVSVTSGKYGGYYCEEHGYIIGIMSIMPKTAYQQGIPKHFLKTTDFTEFYWPSFANLGEQEIKNSEIFAYTPTGDSVFGYIPRYAEYKFINNRISGQFETTLAFWHMSRIFGTLPALNDQFIKCTPRTDVFAVAASEQIYAHILHKIRAVRRMPKFGTPTF